MHCPAIKGGSQHSPHQIQGLDSLVSNGGLLHVAVGPCLQQLSGWNYLEPLPTGMKELEWIRHVDNSSFTSLVFSTMARDSRNFYKHLASLLADKWDQPYSTTMN